jgi:hypothetical protein
MSRSNIRKPELITVQVTATTYQCDGCGKDISRDDHEDSYAHELVITLDQEECVSLLLMRDYCPACLEPIWAAISTLVKADPDKDGEAYK